MSKQNRQRRKPGPVPRRPLQQRDIGGLKFFRLIRDFLARLHSHKDCHNRVLHYDEYASLLMLKFLNPVLTSLRSIQQASTLRNVQKKLGVKRASLGSLSEASHLFDPELLAEVVRELAARAAAEDGPARPSGLSEELELVAVDGSLLDALPRMIWASWMGTHRRTAKLHLEFNILKGIPQQARITEGNASERKVLRDLLAAGILYVIDRGYLDFDLFDAIVEAESSFVCRVKDTICSHDVIEERKLTDADREAGVVSDVVVRLGCKANRRKGGEGWGPYRIVKVHVKASDPSGQWRPRSNRARRNPSKFKPKDYELVLVTDRMDLSAADVATIYRYRWTIELFFRWFKCVLGFSHLICESENGVRILVYCALIVSLLITLWTRRKPTKRTLEMIQLYLQGWAELDEVEDHIARLRELGS